MVRGPETGEIPLTMQIDRAHLVVVARLAENSRYCRRASAGSWPYLPVRDFLLCLFTVPHHRGGTPLAPDAHGAAWRHSFKAGLEEVCLAVALKLSAYRLRTFTFARLTLLCNFLRSTTAAALASENGGRQLSRYAQSATRR